ncbi:hypothetical protein PINS_up000129 [Pythium insidiosum]|nr:hypothetical protein PINS_up000129 [Pythium insidiosum]
MEDMAAMLQQVAGGLQQSFGVVFERVGESLAQSAHMMQVMNEMMETALLHNLVLTTVVRADASSRRRPELLVCIDNRSQIALTDVTLTVTVENERDDGSGVVHQDVLATVGAGSHHELLVPMDPASVGREGRVELAFASPGTKETLRKTQPFRIRLLCMAQVKEVAAPVDSSINNEQLCASSDIIKLTVLRDVLQVGAFNALRTADQGHYLLSLVAPETLQFKPERSFQVSISRSDDAPTGARVVIATTPPTEGEDEETLKRVCRELVGEMESW